jgi:hypothetical protein
MADAGTQKSKSGNVGAKDQKPDEAQGTSEQVVKDDIKDLDADAAQRDEERSESDQDQQQDLDQGMDTGTHDSTYEGVDMDGPEWQIRSTAKNKEEKKDGPDKTPSK